MIASKRCKARSIRLYEDDVNGLELCRFERHEELLT